MNSDSDQPENDFSVIEELTAYLDGELEQAQILQVESRLGSDPAYLAEMQSLQKTWDLLDRLPSVEPGASFTQTTMEMIVGQAVKSEKTKRNRFWIWPVRIAIILAVPACLFAAAFGVNRSFQTQTDRLLVDNLSVVESYPRYDAIECDMEFLVKLNEQALFSGTSLFLENGNAVEIQEPSESGLIPPSEDDRRAFVKSLDVLKKLKLKRKFEDFQKKPLSARERLVEFDEQLSQSPNRVQLTSTLSAYYDWLLKIEAGVRSDLRDLAADERINAIRKIQYDHAIEEFGKGGLTKLFSKEDAEYVLLWCNNLFQLNEKRIRDRFADVFVQYSKAHNMRTPPVDFVRRQARHANISSIVDFLIRADRPFIEQLILDDREISMLFDMLSAKAQEQVYGRTAEQQRELILVWVESANQSQRGISEDALRQFEEQLDVKERDRLEKMSPEDYLETLKRKLIEQRKESQLSPEDWWDQALQKMLDSGGD